MIDLKEFGSALEQIADEKGISKDRVQEVIEMAIAAAYKKDYGEKGQNIQADFDSKAGTAQFYQVFEVVTPDMVITEEEWEAEREGTGEDSDSQDDVDDEEDTESDDEERLIRFNPKRHIYLEDAKEKDPSVEPGDELRIPLESHTEFGRIAAQTAKQVIIQRIREAEREATFEEFKEKEGELVSGVVQRIDRGIVHLDIGRTTGVIFPDEQIPGERYRQGQRVRVYVVRVEKDSRGPSIILSRRHPKMIAELFELEVPEIASGIVEIKAIAREAGSRSKIAVSSNDQSVDPVGACVGQKGIRVTAVINELSGENIDIISWDEDEKSFISNALSPAKVLNVELDEEEGTAHVDVGSDQLSLAIGRRGQNVRLAAKLTGWKIDVRGAGTDKEEEDTDEAKEKDAAPEDEGAETQPEGAEEATDTETDTDTDLPDDEAGGSEEIPDADGDEEDMEDDSEDDGDEGEDDGDEEDENEEETSDNDNEQENGDDDK